MTKKLKDLIPNFLTMSIDQREQLIETSRYNKYVERLALKAHKKKATRKQSKKRTTQAEKLIQKMSPEDIQKALAILAKG